MASKTRCFYKSQFQDYAVNRLRLWVLQIRDITVLRLNLGSGRCVHKAGILNNMVAHKAVENTCDMSWSSVSWRGSKAVSVDQCSSPYSHSPSVHFHRRHVQRYHCRSERSHAEHAISYTPRYPSYLLVSAVVRRGSCLLDTASEKGDSYAWLHFNFLTRLTCWWFWMCCFQVPIQLNDIFIVRLLRLDSH